MSYLGVYLGLALVPFGLLVVTAVLDARHSKIQPAEGVHTAEVEAWPRFGVFLIDIAVILVVTAIAAPFIGANSGALFWAAYLPYFAISYGLGATPAMKLFRMGVRTYGGVRLSVWRGL